MPQQPLHLKTRNIQFKIPHRDLPEPYSVVLRREGQSSAEHLSSALYQDPNQKHALV